jgi:hypothetical protein
MNKSTIRADPPVLLSVPFPDTLSLSVSNVLHMKNRIFHVNFYGLGAN